MLQYVPVDDFYDKTMPHKILRTSYTERMNDYFYGQKMADFQIRRNLKNFEKAFFKYDRKIVFCECCGEISEDHFIENMRWPILRYLFNQLSNFEQRFRWFMTRWKPVAKKPIKITEEPKFEEISCKVKVFYEGKRDYYSDYCFDSLFFLFALLDRYIKEIMKQNNLDTNIDFDFDSLFQ